MRRRDVLALPFAASPRAWLSDATSHVFGAVPSFRDQLAKGIPYWRARLDVACATDVYGSQGIAAGDIDNDGRDEIFVAQSGGLPNRLYKIRDDGTAIDITDRAGIGILDDTTCALFLDTQNRGHQDLVVLRSSGPLLYRNRGDGTFELRPDAFRFATRRQGSFTGMAAADYDGDGLVDLYLCSYIYLQSEEQYRYPSPYHDATNGPPNFLLRNTGEGFVDVTRESGMDENNNRYSFAAAWCDYDRDGKQELYVANDFGRNNLYKFDGKRFRDIAALAGVEDIGPGMSAAWFDADGDGRFDLYVANMWSAPGQRIVREKKLEPAEAYRRHAKGNSLYRNRGDGTFEETRQAEMGRWAWSADGCDIDNDGAPEIFVACGMITGDRNRDLEEFFWDKVVSQTGRLYEEGWNSINQSIREGDSWAGHQPNVAYARSGGEFRDESSNSGFAYADDSRAFAFTDFDGDGNIDILLKSRLAPQVRALRNEAGVGKPVVGIRLTGTKSNRDAIGAQVRIGDQIKQVAAGSGYLSQHTKTLYFQAPSNGQAEILWPSGLVQRLTRLEAGSLHHVSEGKAIVDKKRFRERVAFRDGRVDVDNASQSVSFRLIEPLPMPEAVRGPRERAILGKYLRDLRRDLGPTAIFHRDANDQLTDVELGGGRAATALPFAGEYVTRPGRNLVRLGAAFYSEQMPEAALVYLRQALDSNPSSEAANGLGLMFARQGKTREAREWLQKAIAVDRTYAGAINNLGVLYGQEGQLNDAIAAFEYGISVAPDDDTLYMNLGRIHVQMGQREKARRVMERLLERKPESQLARRAMAELR